MKAFIGLLLFLVFLSRSEASVPPKIAGILIPETSVGSEATLFCSLGSGTKPVLFSWSKNGQDLPSKHVTNTQTSTTLVIPVVKIEDRGRYTCRVKSSFGEDSKSADLVVSGEHKALCSWIQAFDNHMFFIMSSRSSILRKRTIRRDWSTWTRSPSRV